MESQITMTLDVERATKEAFERPRWYLDKTAYNIRIRAETVAEFIQGVRPKAILDIGCGDGSLSVPLLSEENSLTLLDRSREMLSIAATQVPQQLMDHVRFQNDDFMDADIESGNYDLIVCVGVIAYIKDRAGFVRKLYSVLKPGGLLIIECTDSEHFVSAINRVYESIRQGLGGIGFPTVTGSSSDLLEILRKSGFILTGSFRYSLAVPALRRFASQNFCYKAIRAIYGTFANNRRARFGNECLFRLERR
jgi:ubiquinone/menaquinone biosynthesis C-methylase UbiE